MEVATFSEEGLPQVADSRPARDPARGTREGGQPSSDSAGHPDRTEIHGLASFGRSRKRSAQIHRGRY